MTVRAGGAVPSPDRSVDATPPVPNDLIEALCDVGPRIHTKWTRRPAPLGGGLPGGVPMDASKLEIKLRSVATRTTGY